MTLRELLDEANNHLFDADEQRKMIIPDRALITTGELQ